MTDVSGDSMADPAGVQPYEFVPEESEQLDQDPMQPQYGLNDRGVADALDEGYSPPEKWSVLESYGNTPREEREGETLDQRLAEEEPEVWETANLDTDVLDDGEVGDERTGRLVAPNEGIGADVDQEMIGTDVGIDGAAASAEEAAVHTVNEP